VPIYEYLCGYCGTIKDEFFFTYEEAQDLDIFCPECNHVMERVILTPPHKMLLDRSTLKKHSYPSESGIDAKPRKRILNVDNS